MADSRELGASAWRQNIRRLFVALTVFSIAINYAVRLWAFNDADIWWHLRTGQWIVAHHAVPHTDPFSSFGTGKPWFEYSWLFDIATYGFYHLFGLIGVVILQTLLALGIAAALYWITRHAGNFVLRFGLIAAGLLALGALYMPRPWLVTIIIAALEIDFLLEARATGKSRRLWWLLPLFALWANIHIQFVYGLGILGLAIAEPLAHRALPGLFGTSDSRLSLRTLLLTTLGCFAATLINPYHVRIYKVAYELGTQPLIADLLIEMRAPAFRNPGDYFLLLLILGATAALAWRHQRALFPALLLISSAVLAFKSMRDAWFPVVVALAIISRPPAEEAAIAPRRAVNWRGGLAIAAGLILVAALTAHAHHVSQAGIEAHIAQIWPTGAAQAIEKNGYSGPLYNHYNWGGYLIWRLPQLPVSMDGRAIIHGDQRIAHSMATWDGHYEWNSEPELVSARLVIASVNHPLFNTLRSIPRFRLVYQDKVAAVFVRNE